MLYRIFTVFPTHWLLPFKIITGTAEVGTLQMLVCSSPTFCYNNNARALYSRSISQSNRMQKAQR